MIESQLSKFLAVGIFCTGLNYLSFLFLFKLADVNFLIASSAGYLFGLLFGYSLNRSWTFKSNISSITIKISYFLMYVFSLVTGLVMLNMLVVKLNLLTEIANIIVIGYTTILNFLGIKFLVFKK